VNSISGGANDVTKPARNARQQEQFAFGKGFLVRTDCDCLKSFPEPKLKHLWLRPLPVLTSGCLSECSTMRLWRTLLLVVWVSASSGLVHAKQLAVVTDPANTTASLSAADLIKIFRAHTHNWPDGKPVIIVLRDPSSNDMQLVLRKVFHMTPEQARSFVQAHKSGIVVADSDDAVLHFVSSNPGAIGIIDLYSLAKGVNVVKIDGKLPVEQGYFLRGD